MIDWVGLLHIACSYMTIYPCPCSLHIYVCINICVYIYTYIYIDVCMHTYIQICIYIHIYMCIFMYMSVCIYVCIHIKYIMQIYLPILTQVQRHSKPSLPHSCTHLIYNLPHSRIYFIKTHDANIQPISFGVTCSNALSKLRAQSSYVSFHMATETFEF